MYVRISVLVWILLRLLQVSLQAQDRDSVITFTAIVYDASFRPVQESHVININTRRGTITDSLGIFTIPVHSPDTLLIRNIAFRDTLVPVRSILVSRHVVLSRQYYTLQEARIYDWGSTYWDFYNTVLAMPEQQTLGRSMGLPTQDPDYVPPVMNEAYVKSPLFLIRSPVSFFYYNFSKHARSERTLYWMEKNRAKQEHFNDITGVDNISGITGLTGKDMQHFRGFLLQKMKCDIHCTDLEILEEIYSIWAEYQELEKRGML